MGRTSVVILLVLCSFACTKTVYVPVETVRTVTKTERDTVVQVKIERESVFVRTRDTIARAETSIAEAEARVSGGQLALDLRNKDTTVAAETKVVVINTVDSIPYVVPTPVEVKVRYVAWYDKLIRWAGLAILVLSAFGVTIFDIRKMFK